jgi:hypothetical protein
MRKKLLLLSLLFVVLFAHAKSEHLKFMGIPLDGKISSFNRELQKKGFVLDAFSGKEFDGYIYNGIFAGEKAQVFVYFDAKSKIVYQAAVIIKRYSKDSVIKLYEDMRDMLDEKYSQNEAVRFYENMLVEYGEEMKEEGITPFQWKRTTEEEGYEATTICLPNSERNHLLGDIKVFVRDMISNVTNSTEYYLFIKYSDWQNDNSQRKNRMDDL